MGRNFLKYGALSMVLGLAIALAGSLGGLSTDVNPLSITKAQAHGDMAPQAVDTTGLEPLGKEWRESQSLSWKRQ